MVNKKYIKIKKDSAFFIPALLFHKVIAHFSVLGARSLKTVKYFWDDITATGRPYSDPVLPTTKHENIPRFAETFL